jgi:hypothetical protein
LVGVIFNRFTQYIKRSRYCVFGGVVSIFTGVSLVSKLEPLRDSISSPLTDDVFFYSTELMSMPAQGDDIVAPHSLEDILGFQMRPDLLSQRFQAARFSVKRAEI